MTSDMNTTMGDHDQTLTVQYGERAWDDLDGEGVIGGRVERAVLLPFGTNNGNHSVELLIRTRDGQLVHANTTYALFKGCAEVFAHWYRTHE